MCIKLNISTFIKYLLLFRDPSLAGVEDPLGFSTNTEFIKAEPPDQFLPECDSPRSSSNMSPGSYGMPPIHPDLAFFVSLLPTIQALDQDQKLVFQMQVLKALRNIKRPVNDSSSETDHVYDISELKTEEVSMDSTESFDQ